LMFETERVLLADMPFIPVYTYVTKRLVDPRLKGWQSNVMDHHYTKDMFLLKTAEEAADEKAAIEEAVGEDVANEEAADEDVVGKQPTSEETAGEEAADEEVVGEQAAEQVEEIDTDGPST